MQALFVDKTIDIKAHVTYVWQVLTDKEFTKEWAGEFQNNTEELYIDSQWQQGDVVEWKKKGGEVIVTGKVTALEMGALLRFTVGDVTHTQFTLNEEDGITYEFSEKNGNTTLHVRQGDFAVIPNGETYRDITASTWDRVLPKVKKLAEAMQGLHDKGFRKVFITPLPPTTGKNEHTHDEETAHTILSGELSVHDTMGTFLYHAGDTIIFPAGTTHAVNGKEGKMLVGFRG